MQYLSLSHYRFESLLAEGKIPPPDGKMGLGGGSFWYADTLDRSPIRGQTSDSNRQLHSAIRKSDQES
jgi:hypothetical protein